ncbi:MerR family transcriptional regulator [uncultured Alistipes sp.]|jgi:hypothetical protein|uniref:MerR family transcriptional regulator n=1 Tax=uncultured Alistipes sp. TaxID=538949 RepID=UPI0025F559D4|nr:MerR family transcriptional regulator [uncultured Alistipes sp.]
METTKIKLKIGEFSKLNQVTVKTLRHYEEIGLLIPGQVDRWTGYRYYDVGQIGRVNAILYLKRLGFTLEEIKDLFDAGLTRPPQELITAKISECRAKQAELQWRMAELKKLGENLEKTDKMEKVFIKELPAVIVASHRRVIDSYDDLFNLCPNIIGPEMVRLGCECPPPGYCYTIDHTKEYKERDIDIEYCEAVTERKTDSELIRFKQVEAVPTAVCMHHRGNYESMPKTFAELYEYVEKNGYRITDSPRFSYIDGIWNKESAEEWLTEIQIPATR